MTREERKGLDKETINLIKEGEILRERLEKSFLTLRCEIKNSLYLIK